MNDFAIRSAEFLRELQALTERTGIVIGAAPLDGDDATLELCEKPVGYGAYVLDDGSLEWLSIDEARRLERAVRSEALRAALAQAKRDAKAAVDAGLRVSVDYYLDLAADIEAKLEALKANT